MKIKFFITILMLGLSVVAWNQSKETPVEIKLKNGETIEAMHFGKNKCSSNFYADNYILVRGKYKGIVTEIKDFSEIEKIVPVGYNKEPLPSVGNEKGTLKIYKKNGIEVELEEAELVPSCFALGDKYNQISVKIMNPLTNQPVDQVVETRRIQAITFR